MTTIEKLQLLVEMQNKVSKMKESEGFTKKDLCDACIPIRDLLKLTDKETLSVANNTASLSDILYLLDKTPDDITDEALRKERIKAYHKFFSEFRSKFPNSEVELFAVNTIKISLIEKEGKA